MSLGVRGQVIDIRERPDAMPMGRVRVGGASEEVCLAYVPEAAPGDWVVVHAGFAISRVAAAPDDAAAEAGELAAAIRRAVTRPWTLMELSGAQTHALIEAGVDRMLPQRVSLVHGPGCPLCATPLEVIDGAVAIARRPEVLFTSCADTLRAPGSGLSSVHAAGGEVRAVRSPLEAVRLAARSPGRQVVFFSVGFEATAAATAMAVWHAHELGLANFSVLLSHLLAPPAMEAIATTSRIHGFLAAGNVCAVMGYWEYEPLAERYGVPVVVTGHEPVDLLRGTLALIEMLESGRVGVENRYARVVRWRGNVPAQHLVQRVFRVAPGRWRGLGEIARSGLELRAEFASFDARARFDIAPPPAEEPSDCIAGLILQGLRKPDACAAFAARCTPARPLGAPMVSSGGVCAAYHRRVGLDA
ncbi:MAG TPA: hydrogenase formation protein HypD [Longimicrobiales bacterium]|nr:hydrogenase formation protein HypD [Longimicrobiales bacterium]